MVRPFVLRLPTVIIVRSSLPTNSLSLSISILIKAHYYHIGRKTSSLCIFALDIHDVLAVLEPRLSCADKFNENQTAGN